MGKQRCTNSNRSGVTQVERMCSPKVLMGISRFGIVGVKP